MKVRGAKGRESDIQIARFVGAEALPYLDALGALRIAVFREWPYLYEGSAESEANYLRHHAACAQSLTVLAFDGTQVVGASTALPLPQADPAFQAPFEAAQMPLDAVCYFGESVLLPEYRGHGIGRQFFAERLAFARDSGARTAAFCAVERAADDPRRPAEYRPLDAFWQSEGFRAQAEMRATLGWREVGAAKETLQTLRFWLKSLDA